MNCLLFTGITMLGKLLISSFTNSSKKMHQRSPWEKMFLHCVKTYKKTGIKISEAMMLNPDGTTVVRDGSGPGLTKADIMVSY